MFKPLSLALHSHHILGYKKMRWFAPSQGLATLMSDLYTPANIEVMPPPCDDELFTPSLPMKTENKICSVGRICEEKKFEVGLEAAKVLREEYDTRFTYTIVGNVEQASYLDTLNRKIKDYGLSDSVTIIPRGTPDIIRQTYRESLLFWNFSEGYGGIVNMEAMAGGCIPIVSPNFGDTVGGVGFVSETPRETAEISSRLLKTQKESRSLGRCASKYAYTNFTASRFRNRILTELNEIKNGSS